MIQLIIEITTGAIVAGAYIGAFVAIAAVVKAVINLFREKR